MSMAKPLALTLGEPAGIGPDITMMAWLRRNELKLPALRLEQSLGKFLYSFAVDGKLVPRFAAVSRSSNQAATARSR